MATPQTSEGGFSPNGRALVTGAILMGVGGLVGVAGFTVAGLAVIAATRRYVAAMETPPSELAKYHWNRARAAAQAGAGAWRNGAATAPTSS